MHAFFRFCTARVLALFTLMMIILSLVACSPSQKELQLYGSDISGSNFGSELEMVDGSGTLRTIDSFKGKVLVVFFGFTHCPDVCPTALSLLAHVMSNLGAEADKVQVVFITVDPERDTPEMINHYVHAFDPRFIGLTGSLEQLHKTAQSFKTYYAKVHESTNAEQYTMDHSSSFYILDGQGKARVLLAANATPDEITHDIQQILDTAH